MERTNFFKFFAASDRVPSIPLPQEMKKLDVQGLCLYVHDASDWVLEKAKEDWVFITGLAFHLEEQLSLAELATRLLLSDDPLNEMDHWSGWFAVVHAKQGQVHAYHDAAAGHKIYMRGLPSQGKWFGSDPKLSAHWAPLAPHKDKDLRELHDSQWLKKRGIPVGNMTPYEGTRQVGANHRLNWSTFDAERIFPREDAKPMSPDEALDVVIPWLENVMAQATQSHRVNMAVTAGWDSRITLALSRKVKERIHYYTIRHKNTPLTFPDLALPQAMSKEGFEHSIYEDHDAEYAEQWKAVEASFTHANYKRFHSFFCMFPEFQPDQLTIVGTVSEVAKNYLEHIPISTARQALRAAHLVEHPSIEAHFQKWMDQEAPVIERHGYRVLDFLHWEQDVTNFAGLGMQQINHVVHQFSPFNSVKVLQALLSTPPHVRDKYIPKLYAQLIRTAWPELMNHPVNPFFKEDAIRLLKRTGLYNPYKYLGNRMVSRPFKG